MIEKDFYKKTLNKELFNSKDFEFINTFNSDLELLDDKLTIFTKKRELVVLLINNLNNLINTSFFENEKNKEELVTFLNYIETTFNNINNNINSYTTLKNMINSLNSKLSDLFSNIDSSIIENSYYIEKTKKIKSELNSYSIQMNSIKSNTLINEIQIDNFFNDSITLKYITMFNINLNEYIIKNSAEKNSNLKKPDYTAKSLKDSNFETFSENQTLIISEKENKVYLPYTKSELNDYITQYPEKYSSVKDVIKNEFILPLEYFQRHSVIARFREAYALIRDKEMKSVIESLKYAIDLMFRHDLNPTIIAACKTQRQLEDYIDCLEHNELHNFKDFEIKFEINPI